MRPLLFELGPFASPAYGFFVLVGLTVALLLIPRYAKRYGLNAKHLRDLCVVTFVFGAIGCRLFYVFQKFPEFLENPDLKYWFIQQAGVWYGAIIGGFIALMWLMRRYQLPFWKTLDTAAVPVVVGGGIGRLGCLFSGCCFGKACELPWAIQYKNELAHRIHPDLPYDSLHPTPVYELFATLLIGVFLDRFGKRDHLPGAVGLLYVALYASARFIIEYFRADTVRGFVVQPWLSTSQFISLLAIVIVLGVYFYRRKQAEC